MKRSEAVEEIRKILAMNGKDNGMGELEEALLHTMEVLGMLPPSYTIFHKNKGIGGARAASRIDGKWETEDEEK